MVDPQPHRHQGPEPVRLIPCDRTALDDRMRDFDENLRLGNPTLAAHALDQLATAARRSAQTLRPAPPFSAALLRSTPLTSGSPRGARTAGSRCTRTAPECPFRQSKRILSLATAVVAVELRR